MGSRVVSERAPLSNNISLLYSLLYPNRNLKSPKIFALLWEGQPEKCGKKYDFDVSELWNSIYIFEYSREFFFFWLSLPVLLLVAYLLMIIFFYDWGLVIIWEWDGMVVSTVLAVHAEEVGLVD